MKTSQIQLDPGGEWRSALERIRGGAQGRVILVWADKGGPRSPKLTLQLMARRSRKRRVPLALVTGRKDIRALATSYGIPVFSGARQARAEEWVLLEPVLMPRPAFRLEPIELRMMAEIRRNNFFKPR
jgi:hypothetical protein